VHYAATIAGMASANAYVGLSSALGHALSTRFGIPSGAARAGERAGRLSARLPTRCLAGSP
jgi:hypothetical protein